MVERPIQYTYTVLLFSSKKTKGKRQDTESVPLLAPGTESATPDVYIVVEEAKPCSHLARGDLNLGALH